MNETTQKSHGNKKTGLMYPMLQLAVVLFVTLITYWNVTNNGFTDWDDDLYVVNSQLIRSLSFSNILIYFKSITVNLYTPIVTLSYAIDYKLFGLDPFGFHFTNLLLHLANIMLAYVFVYKVLDNKNIAFIACILFAIHPLNVEAVVWISSRKDLLFTFFYLLGLITYLSYHKAKGVGMYVLTFACFLFSCFSKPVAITFPVVLVAIDYFKNGTINRQDILNKIPMIIVSCCFVVLGFYLVSQANAFDTFLVGYNWFDKICLACYSLIYYVYNGIIPSNLTNFHSFPHKYDSLLAAPYLFAPIAVLAIGYVTYRLRKNNLYLFGLALFILTIGPTLRLIPAGYPIAAERYFYLPSIGFFIILAFLLDKLLQFKITPVKYGTILLIFMAVLFYSRTSYSRVNDWKNSITLWESALDNDPTLYLGHTHLGKLYDDNNNKQGALLHYEKALNIYPDNSEILNSAGVILQNNGNLNKAKSYFNESIELDNSSEITYYNRGNIYKQEAKFDLAILDYDRAILIKANFPEALNNRATAKIISGDTLGAYQDFKRATELKPTDKMMKDNYLRVRKLVNSNSGNIAE